MNYCSLARASTVVAASSGVLELRVTVYLEIVMMSCLSTGFSVSFVFRELNVDFVTVIAFCALPGSAMAA